MRYRHIRVHHVNQDRDDNVLREALGQSTEGQGRSSQSRISTSPPSDQSESTGIPDLYSSLGTSQEPSPGKEVNPSTTSRQEPTAAFSEGRTKRDAPQTPAIPSESPNQVDEVFERQRLDPPPRFTCLVCSKSFTRRTTLNSHQRHHTGDRPFLCEFPGCGKAFAQNNDRKRHEKNHGFVKAFRCGGTPPDGCSWGCGKEFARKDGLLEHHHKTVKGAKCLAKRDSAFTMRKDG